MATFLFLLGDSSLVYLPPSLPPIAVPAAEQFFLAPTPLSLRFLPCPLRMARALQKTPLPRRLSPSMLLPRRALRREPIPSRSLIRPRSPFRRLATRRLRLPCRLRAAFPIGRANEQPLPLALLCLLLIIMVSGPAGPLVHPQGVLTPRRESHGRDRLWPSLRPLLLPSHLPRRYPFRPAATAPSLLEFLFQDFHPPLTSCPPQRPTWMPSALLLNYSSGIPPRVIDTLTGRGSYRPSLRATPPCATSFVVGRQLPADFLSCFRSHLSLIHI